MPGQLAKLIRSKYPGQYDDMDDVSLEKAILAKYPDYADLAEPEIEPITGVSFDPVKPKVIEPEPEPEVRTTRTTEEPNRAKLYWDEMNAPTTDITSRAAGSFSEEGLAPLRKNIENPFVASVMGFQEGALEGLGDVASSLTSPVNLITSLLSGGSGAAAKSGLSQLAKLLGVGGKLASAPVAAHGAMETARPDATFSERLMGLAELAGGGAGMLQGVPKGKLSEIGKKVATPDFMEGPSKQRLYELTDKATAGTITRNELIEAQQLNKLVRESQYSRKPIKESEMPHNQTPEVDSGTVPDEIPMSAEQFMESQRLSRGLKNSEIEMWGERVEPELNLDRQSSIEPEISEIADKGPKGPFSLDQYTPETYAADIAYLKEKGIPIPPQMQAMAESMRPTKPIVPEVPSPEITIPNNELHAPKSSADIPGIPGKERIDYLLEKARIETITSQEMVELRELTGAPEVTETGPVRDNSPFAYEKFEDGVMGDETGMMRRALSEDPWAMPERTLEEITELDNWAREQKARNDVTEPELTPEEIANYHADAKVVREARKALNDFEQSYGPDSEEFILAKNELEQIARLDNAKPVGRGKGELVQKQLTGRNIINDGADIIDPSTGEVLDMRQKVLEGEVVGPESDIIKHGGSVIDYNDVDDWGGVKVTNSRGEKYVSERELPFVEDTNRMVKKRMARNAGESREWANSVVPESVANEISSPQPKPKLRLNNDGTYTDTNTGEVLDLNTGRGVNEPPQLPPNEPPFNPPPEPPFDPNRPFESWKSDPSDQTFFETGSEGFDTGPINKIDEDIQQIQLSIDNILNPPKTNWLKEGMSASKAMMSAIDLPPLRQALPAISTKAWWTSWDEMARAYGSQEAFNASQARIKNDPLFGNWIKGGGAFTDQLTNPEDQFVSLIMQKNIPGTNFNPIRGGQRGSIAYLNQLRFDNFKAMYKAGKAAADLPGLTPDEKMAINPAQNEVLVKQIVDFANDTSGRGSLDFSKTGEGLANLERVSGYLNAGLWSPHLISSRVKMYNRYFNPVSWYNMPPPIRKATAKSLLGVATAWAGTTYALSQIPGVNVSLNPTSADFGKVRIGNQRQDFSGAFQPYLVAVARLVSGLTTSSMKPNSKPQEMGQNFGGQTRESTIEQFGINKTSPFISYAYDLFNASKARPFNVADRTFQLALPMMVDDTVQVLKENPWMLPMLAPSFFGSSSQIYGGQDRGEGQIIPRKWDWQITGGSPW